MLRSALLALIAPLRATGADVLTFDLYEWTSNPYISPRFAPTMGRRLTQLTEITRAVSAEVGGIHARLREGPAAGDRDRFSRAERHFPANVPGRPTRPSRRRRWRP
ncbi:MAG TPA: hypothetical protein VNT03_04705 [Baekduia sp.]|nr:hypothetical protein [Baekduia sp.]